MDFNDQITLICPTYQRHKQLKRNWDFYSKTNVKIIYYDGSKNIFTKSNNPNKNITYLHGEISYLERIKKMISMVQTPYICMMDDEDIFLPESLSKCVNFLEENLDYVSCIGKTLGISKISRMIKLDLINDPNDESDLSDNIFEKRLSHHFSNYFTRHFYSVMRTEVFREIYDNFYDIDSDCYAISELIFEFLTISYGKSKVLPVLHWISVDDSEKNLLDEKIPTNPHDVNKINLSFPNWWSSKNKVQLKQKKEILDFLKFNSKEKIDEYKIKTIFNLFIKSNNFKNSILTKFNFVLKFVFLFRKNKLYREIYYLIKFIYLKLYNLKNIYFIFFLDRHNKKVFQKMNSKNLKIDKKILEIFK